jgi:hypothetical protein
MVSMSQDFLYKLLGNGRVGDSCKSKKVSPVHLWHSKVSPTTSVDTAVDGSLGLECIRGNNRSRATNTDGSRGSCPVDFPLVGFDLCGGPPNYTEHPGLDSSRKCTRGAAADGGIHPRYRTAPRGVRLAKEPRDRSQSGSAHGALWMGSQVAFTRNGWK